MSFRAYMMIASVMLAAPVASAQQTQAYAAAYGGAIPSQCTGSYVDLANLPHCRCVLQPPTVVIQGRAMMRAGTSCGDAIEKRAIASSVDLAVSVSPSPVRGGGPMTVVVSIKNVSRADVPVVIRGGAPFLRNMLDIRNASGADVARDDKCGEGFSASSTNHLVVLPPSGVAEWRLPWQASTRVTDSACAVSWRPLPSGTYGTAIQLHQLVQIPTPVATGTLLVQ